MGNINEKIFIEDDGTIIRTDADYHSTILNIIRIGANKRGILAAYKARKRCYEIVRDNTKRVDYKEYVEGIMLDNYPNEFKKAELGIPFLIYLTLFLLFMITFFVCLFYEMFEHARLFIDWGGYGGIDGYYPWGVTFMVILLILSIIFGLKARLCNPRKFKLEVRK